MQPRQKTARTSARAQWRKPLAIATASVAAVALGAVGLSGPLAPASAAQSDESEAEGRLITGGGVVNLNDIAEIAGAYSATPTAPGEVNSPLSLEVLNALNIDLGDGVQLFGENGVIGLGALGQYANTAEGADPLASAGLVNADGSIAIGGGDPSENAYLDLSPLLDEAGLDGLLDDARVELGAISALATVDENGDPVGDYQIANGTLLLTSPAIAGLSGTLSEGLDEVSGPINDLTGEGGVIDGEIGPLLSDLADTIDGVLGPLGSVDDLGVSATVDLDLQAALQSVLEEPLTDEDSAVTIDLSTGEVSVDLARLVADSQGGDYDGTLNNLPVNTEVLGPDVIQAALDGAIGSTLDQIPALVVEAVTDALHAADVNIAITGAINALGGNNIGTVDVQLSGTLGDFISAEGSEDPVVDTSGTNVIGLPVGDLLEPIAQAVTNEILPALVDPLSEAITDEGTLDTIFRPAVEGLNEVLSPLAAGITDNLISLTANVQESPGEFVDENGYNEGSFTQRALQLSLLPNDPLVELSLASATIRVTDEDQDPDTDADAAADPDADVDASTDPDASADDSTDPDASADDSTDPDSSADSTGTPDGSADDSADPDADANTNASASAAASANADDDSNAAAEAAAQAAADPDSDTAASAAADQDATAAAQAAANEDASSDASANVDADANAAAAAAAQAAADADNSSATNADQSAAADATADEDANAAAAAAAEAASTADSSAEASAAASATSAADGDESGLEASVRYTEIVRGTGVVQEVYGSGFAAGESVTATVNSTPFDLTATANEDGDVTFTFEVDSDFELGDHHVILVGDTSGEVPEANTHTDFVVVTAGGGSASADDAGDGDALPDTGADLNTGLLVGAVLLLLLGGGLAVVAKLRRRGQAG